MSAVLIYQDKALQWNQAPDTAGKGENVMGYELTQKCVTAYCRAMREEEKSPETVEKYRRTACAFARWLDGREVTKELAAQWKASLLTAGYAPASINAMVSAINGLFRFLVWDGFRVRFLRVQRRLFREASRELTREEYDRLHTTASAMGRKRLCLLMETLAATGMRVSEARYITVEAARRGCAEIALKGKIRVILLSGKLCRKLLRYAREQRILSGAIFRTRSGREMSRHQIWMELKGLCSHARVCPSKVFPHNLRRLFATVFYRACRDIVQLADVLGHSSIETTRLYLMTSGAEHRRQLERLGLVV